MAITDHEALSAHIKALKFYKQKCKEDEKWKEFKLILGNEIYLCRNGLSPDTYEKGEKFPHFILLAKDEIGHRQLRELSSRAWSHSFTMFLTRVPTYYSDIEEVIGKNKGHLIASSACFLPGQRVMTTNGYKNIEDIVPGDKVKNLNGDWEDVNYPTSREYNGKGYELISQGNLNNIKATENHKILVGTRNWEKTKTPLRWVEIKDLVLKPGAQKHYGVLPIQKTYSNNKELVYNNKTITITPTLMRFFGLWLGDGWISIGKNHYEIGTVFNDTEFDYYYNDIIKPIELLFDIHFHITKRPAHHRVDAVCSNHIFVDFMKGLFGNSKANTKHIPDILKHISKDYDEELLFGYLLADGCFRLREKDGYQYGETISVSISKSLTNDIIHLYNSLGITPTVNIRPEYIDKDNIHHNTSYFTLVSSIALGSVIKTNNHTHQEVINIFNKVIEDHKKNRVVVNNIEYIKIRFRELKSFDINSRVYCLNDDSHSFVCENMVVHNCIGGWLGICKANGAEHNAIAFIKWCKSIFGEDFYLELQPARYQEQIDYNKWLIWLGKETETKCIITTDSHYLKKEDREVHSSFLNSKDGDRETAEFYQYTYMMSSNEVIELMEDYIDKADIQVMFDNTNEINAKVTQYDLAQPQIVPHLSDDRTKHPEWKTIYPMIKIQEKYEYLNKYYNSESEDDRYLIYLGLTKLAYMNLPEEKRTQYIERLETELTECWLVSERLGQPISSYLLMVRNIIQIMWDKAESLVGISRGSAGVMLINYLIGVTQMNPLEQGLYLPHWRSA